MLAGRVAALDDHGPFCKGNRLEDAKAGGARAAHPGEQEAGLGAQEGQRFGDFRNQGDGGAL